MLNKNKFNRTYKEYVRDAVKELKKSLPGTIEISILRDSFCNDRIKDEINRKVLCYEGAIKAMIDNKKPPFIINKHVKPQENCISDVRVPGEIRECQYITNGPIQVKGLHYIGNEWFVEDFVHHLYPAKELVTYVVQLFDYSWYR